MLICVATRRHAYCSSTNQCLQILTTEKIPDLRLVVFQARVMIKTERPASHCNKSQRRSKHILPLHTWPPCFTTVKHHNLMLRVPLTTKFPPRTSKRHRASPVEIATRLGEEKGTPRHGVFPGGHRSKC